MTTHTPGPWLIERSYDRRIFIGSDEYVDGNNCFAHVYERDSHISARDVTLANARLIAAAPELLDALRPFAECCEYIGETESPEEWAKFRLLISHYRAAKAALAKATGAPKS